MNRIAISRILQSAHARKLICANACPSTRRQLGTTTARKTDGVYKALTAMRVRIPWIEALTKQREQEKWPAKQSSTPPESPNRNLLPKKMSESFHKVVCTILQSDIFFGRLMKIVDHPSSTGSLASGQLSQCQWPHQVCFGQKCNAGFSKLKQS